MKSVFFVNMLNCLRLRRKHTANVTTYKLKYLLTRNGSPIHTCASNRFRTQLSVARNAHGPKVNFSHRNVHATVALSSTLSGAQEVRKYDSNALPRKAKVVICGGGVMGASVAYHLALKGLGNDVVLLEQERLAMNRIFK